VGDKVLYDVWFLVAGSVVAPSYRVLQVGPCKWGHCMGEMGVGDKVLYDVLMRTSAFYYWKCLSRKRVCVAG